MLIAGGNGCGTTWQPAEGLTIPQIRYSTNTTANGFYVDGSTSDTSGNDIADTFVIYLNVDNSSTFGLTNQPTTFPTLQPSNAPTPTPTNSPS